MSHMTFYAIYLSLSLGTTIWVGRTLRASGCKFLVQALESSDTADTVNQLLQIGFYLANVGYIALVFRTWEPLQTAQQVLEVGLPKLGGVLLILGLIHLFNMLILARFRRTGRNVPRSSRNAAVHTPTKVLEEAYHLRS
jgi:hypothetical protein